MHQCVIVNFCNFAILSFFGLIIMKFTPNCRAKELLMLFTNFGSFGSFLDWEGADIRPQNSPRKILVIFIPYISELVSHKVQVGMCVRYSSNQSAHLHSLISLSFPPEEMLNLWLPIERPSKTDQTVQMHRGPIKDYNQTVQMCRLIWVFDGHTCQLVPYAEYLLSCCFSCYMSWVMTKLKIICTFIEDLDHPGHQTSQPNQINLRCLHSAHTDQPGHPHSLIRVITVHAQKRQRLLCLLGSFECRLYFVFFFYINFFEKLFQNKMSVKKFGSWSGWHSKRLA